MSLPIAVSLLTESNPYLMDSARYTGAPYYAAMASLKVGADLSFIFTAEEASLPIKCYSPELMVQPVYSGKDMDELARNDQLDSPRAEKLINDMVSEVSTGMERIHCLVIGPGLGRCPLVFRAVAKIIQEARQQNLYLVLDADALYMMSLPEYRHLLRGYKRAVLTPNVMEYKRLFNDTDGADRRPEDLGSVTIVRKGKEDAIIRQEQSLMTCDEVGGLKRAGGVGDILAGTIGTLVAWNDILSERGVADDDDLSLACWTACCFVKRGTKAAYQAKRRSMTAPDVLEVIGETIDSMTRDD